MKLTVFKEILSWMTSATFTEIDVGKCTWLRRNHAAPLPQLLGPGTHTKKKHLRRHTKPWICWVSSL